MEDREYRGGVRGGMWYLILYWVRYGNGSNRKIIWGGSGNFSRLLVTMVGIVFGSLSGKIICRRRGLSFLRSWIWGYGGCLLWMIDWKGGNQCYSIMMRECDLHCDSVSYPYWFYCDNCCCCIRYPFHLRKLLTFYRLIRTQLIFRLITHLYLRSYSLVRWYCSWGCRYHR